MRKYVRWKVFKPERNECRHDIDEWASCGDEGMFFSAIFSISRQGVAHITSNFMAVAMAHTEAPIRKIIADAPDAENANRCSNRDCGNGMT
jgi:hypothetical protein